MEQHDQQPYFLNDFEESVWGKKLIEKAAQLNISADSISAYYKTPQFDAVIVCNRESDLQHAVELRNLIRDNITLADGTKPDILINEQLGSKTQQSSTIMTWVHEALRRSTFVFVLMSDHFSDNKERLQYMEYMYQRSIADDSTNKYNIFPFYMPGFDKSKMRDESSSIPDFNLVNVDGINLTKDGNERLAFARQLSKKDLVDAFNVRLNLKMKRMDDALEVFEDDMRKCDTARLAAHLTKILNLRNKVKANEPFWTDVANAVDRFQEIYPGYLQSVGEAMGGVHAMLGVSSEAEPDNLPYPPPNIAGSQQGSTPSSIHVDSETPSQQSTSQLNGAMAAAAISPQNTAPTQQTGFKDVTAETINQLSFEKAEVVNITVTYVQQFVASSGPATVTQSQPLHK